MLDGSECFEVVPIPGKGHGCRATRDIERGERIFSEEPVVQQGPGLPALQVAVDRMPVEARRRFFSLTQNEIKYGVKLTARGVFMTNAHPCHDFSPLHRGIFPTIARFNHACEPSAVYRWNAALGKLTVHAVKRILVGSEICVSYSFDGLRREQRQKHLRDIFGFSCTCAKCSLSGEALRQSDERLSALGDVDACTSDLCVGDGTRHFLRDALRTPPSDFLARIDKKHQLICAEFDRGIMDGIECYLQAFNEICERIASKLLKGADAADKGDAAVIQRAAATFGGSASALRGAAEEYLVAARDWASRAKDATLDLKGSDSAAYKLWAAALEDGCWSQGGTLNFHVRWIDAGLARHSFCHRLVV